MDLNLLSGAEAERLRHSFLFRDVDADFVARALSDPRCELALFGKGETVYSEKNYRRSIGYVLSGSIQVSKTTADGHRFIMNTLSPGSFFGVAAVFCDSPDYVTELAVSSSCRIVFFAQPLLKDLVSESPAAAVNYISFLSDRIRFLNNKIQGLLSADAGHALANFLMENCREDNGELVVRLDGSISALAGKLNIGRSSLYRSFDVLVADGLISREGKRIKILNPQGLVQYISAD